MQTRRILGKAAQVITFLFAMFGGFLKNVAPPQGEGKFALGLASTLALVLLLLFTALPERNPRPSLEAVAARRLDGRAGREGPLRDAPGDTQETGDAAYELVGSRRLPLHPGLHLSQDISRCLRIPDRARQPLVAESRPRPPGSTSGEPGAGPCPSPVSLTIHRARPTHRRAPLVSPRWRQRRAHSRKASQVWRSMDPRSAISRASETSAAAPARSPHSLLDAARASRPAGR